MARAGVRWGESRLDSAK